jgi:hypothetical protein
MVFVPVISRSSKRYDTLFSVDLKAEKRTITTTCLVAANNGAPTLTGTTTACLIAIGGGAWALAANYLPNSGSRLGYFSSFW